MAGIHAGLKQARCPYGFVLACDMPLAEPKLMELIARRRWQYDVVLPCRNQYMEPLFGIYKKSLYLPIEKMLQQGERCILDLYPQVRMNYIPAAEWLPVVGHQQVFFNINEPEDYLNFLNGRQGGKKQEQRKSYYLAFCNQQKEAEEDVAEQCCAENKG